MQRTNPLYLFGMALANAAANDTKFPLGKVQDAFQTWQTQADAHEQKKDALLATYNTIHLGPRNQRVIAYQTYLDERKKKLDMVPSRGDRTAAIRDMLAVALPEEIKEGVYLPNSVYTRYFP